MMRFRLLAVACILSMSLGLVAHAQSLGAEPLTVQIDPQYPAPYSTITITPGSTIYDLGASTVTISVNGKAIATGSGSAPATYTVGGAGENDTVTVSAATPSGTFTKSVTVSPASVALVEEPISTTHPFYEGGALVAPEGRVRLTVIPDLRTSATGASISASSLVYTWKSGDQLLESSSGIGRSTLLLSAPLRYRDAVISVTVSTQDGTVGGQASIDIAPGDTNLVIYKDGPLLGPMFDAAVGTDYTMTSDEDTFRAVPYSFATAPTLAWSVGGSLSGTDPVVTVRTTGSSAGSAALSVTATEPNSYETATNATTIHFGASPTSGSIFDL